MEATKSTAAAQTTTKKKKKISPYMVFSTVVIILLAIAFAFPLYWIITGSFKTQVSINATTPEWWPSAVSYTHLDVYKRQAPRRAGGGVVPGRMEDALGIPPAQQKSRRPISS